MTVLSIILFQSSFTIGGDFHYWRYKMESDQIRNYINNKANFIECKTQDEANMVPLDEYTFVKFADPRDCYIFKRRAGK